MSDYLTAIDNCVSTTKNENTAESDTITCDIPRAYDVMCDYTRKQIQSYMQWNKAPGNHTDIRFLPYNCICKKDTVHKAAVDHIKAQWTLYGTPDGISPTDPISWSYSDLIKQYTLDIFNGTK